jgi:hypothetical protein
MSADSDLDILEGMKDIDIILLGANTYKMLLNFGQLQIRKKKSLLIA